MKPGILSIAAIVCFVSVSCNKKTKTPTPGGVTADFSVGPVADVTVPADKETEINFVIDPMQSGDTEYECALSGIPNPCTYTFIPGTGMDGKINGRLNLVANDAKQGEYPITATITGKSGASKTVPFKLTIADPVICSRYMAGIYQDAAKQEYITIVTDKTTENGMIIKWSPDINVTIDCDAKILILNTTYSWPGSSASGYKTTTIYGAGTFASPNEIQLSFTQEEITGAAGSTPQKITTNHSYHLRR